MTQSVIFVSYSHKDERQKDRLLLQLGVLQRERLVDLWSDDRIRAGADWQQEITVAIAQAKVAILIVSANFLTSEFILREEVPALLKRRQSEGLTVFPVIAKACAWQEVKWLSSMNVRPKNGRPIWGGNRNIDDDLAAITKEVASIVKTNPFITPTMLEKNKEPTTLTEIPGSHVNTGDTLIGTEKTLEGEEKPSERVIDKKVSLQEAEEAVEPKANRTKVAVSATIPFTNLLSRNYRDEIGVDLLSATGTEFIGRTNHSMVEKCLISGKYYVVKRTIQSSCNPAALRQLIGKNVTGNEGKVSVLVATPLAVWETDDYVWELYPFYKGITLRELILDNRYRIQDAILGQIFNALIGAVNRLHEEGVLHRDISPSNILISGKEEYLQLTLIDCSFCCFEKQEQLPVQDPSYSAPEQILGRAVRNSDLYSIAATIYFLGNGNPPPNWDDKLSLREGLENLDSGNYWLSSRFKVREDSLLLERSDGWDYSSSSIYPLGKVVESLLKIAVSDRPSNLAEILLQPVSQALEVFPRLKSILNVGTLGYLIISSNGFRFFDKRKSIAYINNLRIEDKRLQECVQTLLGESNIP